MTRDDAAVLETVRQRALLEEINSGRLARLLPVAALIIFAAVVGSPVYLLTFGVPHLIGYTAYFGISAKATRSQESPGRSRLVFWTTLCRALLMAHTCWLALDLRFAHQLKADATLLLVGSLVLATLQNQSSRAIYFLGLSFPVLSLLLIAIWRPSGEAHTGVVMILLLAAIGSAAARQKRIVRRAHILQAASDASVETVRKALSVAELAEEVANIGHWRVGRDGPPEWSGGMYKIFGVSIGEPPRSIAEVLSFFRMEDKLRVELMLERSFAMEQGFSLECPITRAGGEVRIISVRAIYEKGASETEGWLLGVVQDVTEARQAEEQVKTAEARFRLLADNGSDIVTKCDLEGRFKYVSPAVEAMTGYTVGDVLGSRAIDLVHPDDRERVALEIAQALRTPAGQQIEHRHIRRDGNVIWVQSQPRLARNPVDGKPFAVTDALRDITERKLAEAALLETQNRYRLLADNANDMIARYSADGTFLYLSPSIEGILGYKPEELVGRNTFETMHPDDHAATRDIYMAYSKGGPDAESPRVEYRAIRKDGAILWFEAHPRAIFDDEGRVCEFQDIVRDITERKAMETELAAAKVEAESASAAKADFLANMSHEIRTPLNSIIGFSRLMAEAPELTPETRRRATIVRDASQSLVVIVNDVLDFSKFESEGVSLAPEPIDLVDLIATTAELIQPEADAKGVVLKLSTPQGPLPVLVDPTRLRQVLLNLLANAVKFTEEGSVELSLSRSSDGRLKFAIKDTGIGIPANRQSAVFQRFAQADGSVVRRFGGSGLGLTICKSIVTAMGGEIAVHSVVGKGSIFWFALDLADAPPLTASWDIAPNRPAAAARVLLVDDNAANCELFKALIDQEGVEITCSDSGADAIERVQHSHFDVVFMDVQMPIMDGLEATRRLRKLGYDLPIVALTANVLDGQIRQCEAAGMNGHLGKPFNSKGILASIARWRNAENTVRPAVDTALFEALKSSVGYPKMQHFLRTLELQVDDLKRLIGSRDVTLDEIGRAAHSIRGYAGTLGFSRLGVDLEGVEQACVQSQRIDMVVSMARAALEGVESEIGLCQSMKNEVGRGAFQSAAMP